MKKILLTLLAVCLVTVIYAQQGQSNKINVRIKDVARLAGNEEYTLIGYGVVTGLTGTGDSDETLIQRTIANMMQNFKIVVAEDDIKANNCASVMITVRIKGTAHKGDMINATVSSVGDAKSLKGGELMLTPLLGTDAEVWAIAQGSVTTGGFYFGEKEAGGNTVQVNHPTVGTLTKGAKLLKEIGTGIRNKDVLTYYLNNPDYTTAVNMVSSVNKKFFGTAVAHDASVIKIRVPKEFKEENRVIAFISQIEQLYFHSDQKAKVVFNERTGTIVIGANVKISEVAVSYGSITVDIKKLDAISQPNVLAPDSATTERVNDTTTSVNEERNDVFPIPNTTTVGDMVKVLNAMGVNSRQIMLIFFALKEAGALHAELESI